MGAETTERLYGVCDYYDAEALLTDAERRVLGRLRTFLDEQAHPLLADYWERGDFPDQLTGPLIDLDLMEPAEVTGPPGPGHTPARGIYHGFRIFELARTDASWPPSTPPRRASSGPPSRWAPPRSSGTNGCPGCWTSRSRASSP